MSVLDILRQLLHQLQEQPASIQSVAVHRGGDPRTVVIQINDRAITLTDHYMQAVPDAVPRCLSDLLRASRECRSCRCTGRVARVDKVCPACRGVGWIK